MKWFIVYKEGLRKRKWMFKDDFEEWKEYKRTLAFLEDSMWGKQKHAILKSFYGRDWHDKVLIRQRSN